MKTADKKNKIKRGGSAARVILSFYKSCMAESQLDMGIDVEKEHKDIYEYLSNHLKKQGVDMPLSEKKFYEMIAKAHIRELPDYYTRLKEMEGGMHKEALDFTSIAPLLKPEGKIDDRELTRILRLSIAAELDAIHLYELIADASDDERVKKLMQDVANEEKVHAFEFQAMLDSISPEEKEFKEEADKEVKDKFGVGE
jgi:rubrerythrin